MSDHKTRMSSHEVHNKYCDSHFEKTHRFITFDFCLLQLDMLTILRMNKRFMAFVRKHYPEALRHLDRVRSPAPTPLAL